MTKIFPIIPQKRHLNTKVRASDVHVVFFSLETDMVITFNEFYRSLVSQQKSDCL